MSKLNLLARTTVCWMLLGIWQGNLPSACAQAPAPDPDSVANPDAAPKPVAGTPAQPRITVFQGPTITTGGKNGPTIELPAGPSGVGFGIDGLGGDPQDRIKQELQYLLQTKQVLLVWVFDQSTSMADERESIIARIDRIYADLADDAKTKGDALKTAVVGYGRQVTIRTPQPLSDRKTITSAIRDLPTDASGVELQLAAMQRAIEAFHPTAVDEKRQLVLFLVTDESGDPTTNASLLESTIELAKRANCRVNVLGREAVFSGRSARMSANKAAGGAATESNLDRGPETADFEALQFNGLTRRTDAFPSGFGPYEQTRLARETGGIFFMISTKEPGLVGRVDLEYDADVMRPFLPWTGPRDQYIAERDKSPLRSAVFQVIKDLDPSTPRDGAGKRGEVKTSFSIDRATFAKEAAEESAQVDELLRSLEKSQRSLEAVAAHRAREKSPRWRANFDLTYAQVCAYQARLKEYRWYVKLFVDNPKPVKNILGAARPTTNWAIHSVQRLLKPDETAKQREMADELFREIQKEHAGTPWAERAKAESLRGYGVQLVEEHDGTLMFRMPRDY